MDTNTFKFKYISSATTTVFGTQPSGVLHSIIVGETAAGSITVSDAVGTIAVLKASVSEGSYVLDVAYTGSLTVVTAGASKITIAYR